MKDFNCPRCNSTVVINRSSILLSNPEKYQVECVSCQWYGYLVCDDVGRVLTDEEIEKIKNTEIEKAIELKQKEIEEKANRVEKTSKKIEFHNEITGKTIFVETKTFENGEIETRSSADREPFEQKPINYIKHKSILAGARELIKHGFIAVNEINTTEKGIEEEKIDQEFNKILREKIQEMEKQKKPERDLGFSR